MKQHLRNLSKTFLIATLCIAHSAWSHDDDDRGCSGKSKTFCNITVTRSAKLGTLFVTGNETVGGNVNIGGNLSVNGIAYFANIFVNGIPITDTLSLRTLRLLEDPSNGTDAITLQAPASLPSSYALILPSDDGNPGDLLTTDGSGNLSWSAGGSGGGIVNLIADDAGIATGTNVTIAGGNDISTTASGNTLTVNISGTTNHALQVGDATGGITSLAVATNGQLPIGSA